MTTFENLAVDMYTGAVANWRAQGLIVSDALTAIGLIKSGDTGQINWATAALPSVGVSGGYEIRKFNDTLQATKPIFVRIDYSRGSNAPIIYKYTFGVSTDGAGTITGATRVIDMNTSFTLVTAAATIFRPIWMCGFMTVNDACVSATLGSLAAFGATPTFAQGFAIQRTVNLDGTPNGDGFFIRASDGSTAANNDSDFYDYATAAWRGHPGLFMNNSSAALSDPVVTPSGGSAGISGNAFGVMPWIPLGRYRMENGLMDWFSVHKAVKAVGDTLTIERFGVARTFKAYGGILRTIDSAASVHLWSPVFLYE